MSSELTVDPAPACAVCGGSGLVLHDGVRDLVFGAPGLWRYRRCTTCRLVWQDPMVTERDVGRLYENYYTHTSPPPPERSRARRLYRAAQRGYLANRYGYDSPHRWARLLGRVLAWHPGRRADADFVAQYLPASRRGRLLDVGCGHGATLVEMQSLGWAPEGVEFDPRAAQVARSRGFAVATGTVFTAPLAAVAYDAVTMSHVIEHVHGPIETLRRCGELLTAAGTLVAVTPNADSWGHEVFGPAWRGLEPPRHLHVFSRPALALAAQRAGFTDVEVGVTIRNARGIFDISRAIQAAAAGAVRYQDPEPTVRAELWQFEEWWRRRSHADSGEELVLTARGFAPAVLAPAV